MALVFRSGFRGNPAIPGWGLGCWCLDTGFGFTPPFLAGGLWCVRFCLGFGLRPAIPGWGFGACVVVCALCLYPAIPGSGVRCGCVCFGSGFGCTPLSWLGCVVWLCVLGLRVRLRLATPGLGFGVCVCLCASSARTPPLLAGVLGCVCLWARSACTPPLLAGVCVVAVCAWARGSAAPRNSWLGFWGLRVFVCALRLYAATPVRGVGVCVCLYARSACTLPLLAGVCGVGVCDWTRVSAAPRHSWLGCWAVRVFVCELSLYPATPGWALQCGCVCLGSGFGCAPPLLAGVCGLWVECCLAPVPVPWFVACCGRLPGLRHLVAVVALHLSVCLGCGRQRPRAWHVRKSFFGFYALLAKRFSLPIRRVRG